MGYWVFLEQEAHSQVGPQIKATIGIQSSPFVNQEQEINFHKGSLKTVPTNQLIQRNDNYCFRDLWLCDCCQNSLLTESIWICLDTQILFYVL